MDVNYQELANEILFKHNFGVCDESPPKITYGRGFTAEIEWFVCQNIFSTIPLIINELCKTRKSIYITLC